MADTHPDKSKIVDDRAMALALTHEETAWIISFFAGYAPDNLADLLDEIEEDRAASRLASTDSGSYTSQVEGGDD